jgi:CRP-like cAMP-binding protein
MNFSETELSSALDKAAAGRSYEDILLIKSYISTLDLVKSRFATIRSEQLDYLCRAVNIESFQPKARIFEKGDFADKMYVVFAGCCSLIDSTQVGEKESSNECFSGMSFGEDAILANIHRPCAAYNESAFVTKLLSVDRLSYLDFLADAYDANSTLSSNSKARGSIENIMSILQKPRHIRTASDVESLAAFLGREMYVSFKLIIIVVNNNCIIEICHLFIPWKRFFDYFIAFETFLLQSVFSTIPW